jgi:hypothetical protein
MTKFAASRPTVINNLSWGFETIVVQRFLSIAGLWAVITTDDN